MADEKPVDPGALGIASANQVPNNVGRYALDPLSHAVAAGYRQALKQGVPPHQILEVQVNEICSVIAMIDPPQVREQLVKDIIGHIPNLVVQHVNARFALPGGLVHPSAGVPT